MRPFRHRAATKQRKANIKALQEALDRIKLEIESDGGLHDPRRRAILVSKNIAVSWIFYDEQGRHDVEVLVFLTDLGSKATMNWRMLGDELDGIDGMVYHALLLILAEAYLERFAKTGGTDVFWRDEALAMYARFLRDDPGEQQDDGSVDSAAEIWQDLESDDLTYVNSRDTTAGGCVSPEAREMNLEMARIIQAEAFDRLHLRDVRRNIRRGRGVIRLRENHVSE